MTLFELIYTIKEPELIDSYTIKGIITIQRNFWNTAKTKKVSWQTPIYEYVYTSEYPLYGDDVSNAILEVKDQLTNIKGLLERISFGS